MATLVRPKSSSRLSLSSLLRSQVPKPFPRELIQQDAPVVTSRSTQVVDGENEVGPSQASSPETLNELMPSIAYVQKSCLMTLNNLLSAPSQWSPILPERRHSMPSSPHGSSSHPDFDSPSAALQTIVDNLRNQASGDMTEIRTSDNDSALIHELRERVESLSSTLDPSDASLATALISLLSDFNRLSIIQASRSTSEGHTPMVQATPLDQPPSNIFDTLTHQLSNLQLERLASQSSRVSLAAPPVLAVETALLWSHIDEELDAVVSMCKERTELSSRVPPDSLPPQYDEEKGYSFDNPPDYEYGARTSLDSLKSGDRQSMHSQVINPGGRHIDEKMRLDLEAVSIAIDRLYLVAPQLHNQRVELKSSKLAQMEKARQTARSTPIDKGKDRDVDDLENMLNLLGKASDRTYPGQSVILEGGMSKRLEIARMRDLAKREAFVEHLARHSSAGRIHGQDAVLQPRIRDPEALLTLPEFIRESVPREQLKDPQALLTLPEFVRELPPSPPWDFEDELSPPAGVKEKKHRSRSSSAPSMSWLRGSSVSKSGVKSGNHSRNSSRAFQTGFDIIYVAEHHENLQHVLVFFTVTGGTPGVDIEAEILPPFPDSGTEGGDFLVIKSGPQVSYPLRLPARVALGKQIVRVQNGHYEIKLAVTPSSKPTPGTSGEPEALLSASELLTARPTSFICASCSLPLIQSSKINDYRDLPSEHWQELVEAWMCHTDQRLHDQVVAHGKGGFWPQPGQALVGGSYILFEESSITQHNMHLAGESKPGENWRLVRCLCGAVVGRCQERPSENEPPALVFRVLKYSIRLVSPTVHITNIPLTAFVVEDMMEFVQAHASYRFVIRDEEDELPRILVWLFKPSLPIAYNSMSARTIDRGASIQAAKVLYKLLGPADASSDIKSILSRYPNFPQAEYLSYPMAICRRLARNLRESTLIYPETLRNMTGLDVGWLHRAYSSRI